MEPIQEVDIAVIGAGISGLYAAYRLSGADGSPPIKRAGPRRIAIFEATERTGGRLWSGKLEGVETIPAEYGGMFFSQSQPIVRRLCMEHLGLASTAVDVRTDLAYLRGKRLSYADLADPDQVPYRLAADEQGLSYHALILLALERIVPGLKTMWPLSPDGSFAQTQAVLREAQFHGRKLHDWGFWNLLAQVLSYEAYQLLLGAVGSFSMLSNWNGYDAILSLITDMGGGQWHKLINGYEELPTTLAERFRAAGGDIRLGASLNKISPHPSGKLLLAFNETGSQRQLIAEQVILTLSQRALAELARNSPMLQVGNVQHAIDAVRPVSASKLFLVFDEPWWRNVPGGPGRISRDELALSRTDLPLRQCYYEGTDPATGKGLIIAGYGDGRSVEFWRALARTTMEKGVVEQAPSELAIAEIRDQLGELHGVTVPRPAGGVFVDWDAAPYWGGWHLWQPGFQGWQIARRIQRPIAGQKVFVCGETWSTMQGWTEGSLSSTEFLLREQFHMAAPAWLQDDDALIGYQP